MMFKASPPTSVAHGSRRNTIRLSCVLIRRQTGNSSCRRRTCCPISNGCRQHRPIQEQTTCHSGEPSSPSTTRSGTSTAQATAGTANAVSPVPTNPQPPFRLLLYHSNPRTRHKEASKTIQAKTPPSSPTNIRTSRQTANIAHSTSQDSRRSLNTYSSTGQKTATIARILMGVSIM